jgi:pimeloyl-[acyl-carrier protein] methyl ester esterase
MAPALFDAFLAALASQQGRTLQRFAALQTRGSATAREELRRLKAVLSATEPRAPAPALKLLRADLRAALAALACPAQLLLGRADQLVPAGPARALNHRLTVQLLEHSAHLPFVSQADAVVTALIRQVSAADAAG